jgi:hypothetical protein
VTFSLRLGGSGEEWMVYQWMYDELMVRKEQPGRINVCDRGVDSKDGVCDHGIKQENMDLITL